MATFKSFTDLQQSKRLAEILPIESADMHYNVNRYDNEYKIFMIPYSELGSYKDNEYQYSVCAWSLAALLGVLPSGYEIVKNYNSFYYVESRDHEKFTDKFNNPVDACVAIIEKLHELKML